MRLMKNKKKIIEEQVTKGHIHLHYSPEQIAELKTMKRGESMDVGMDLTWEGFFMICCGIKADGN